MNKRNNPEVVAGRFSSATTVIVGDGWTARYNFSVGTWLITLTGANFHLISAVASAGQGGGYITTVRTFTDKSFVLANYDANGAAVEASYYTFIAVGL